MPQQRAPRRRSPLTQLGRCFEAKRQRGRKAGNPALRRRRPGAAQAGTISHGVDLRDAGAAIRVSFAHQMSASRVEDMGAAQGPQDFVGRHESVTHEYGIDIVAG